MKKIKSKHLGITAKIGGSMLFTLIIAVVIILSGVLPKFTELVTVTTTKGMSDTAKMYQQLIDASLESISDSIRNTRPIVEISDGLSAESSNTETTDGEANESQDSEAASASDADNSGGPVFNSPSKTLSDIQQENSAYVSALSYADLDGNILYSSDEQLENASVSTERYFQSVVAGNNYAMSDAIIEDEEDPRFTLAFSATNANDEVCGVLLANFSASYLSHILSPIDEEPVYSDSGMELISGVNILDVSGATVYLCDTNGIVLTASDQDWIGFDSDGEGEETADSNSEAASPISITEYKDSGESYYLSSYYISEGSWYFCVDIPHADIFSALYQTIQFVNILVILICIVAALVAYRLSTKITKPIKKTTESLEYLSNLELNKINLTDIKRSKDETGTMLDSIETAVSQIKNVIASVEDSSHAVYTNAMKLSGISDTLQANAQENSQVAEELSAGMEETSATQEQISSDITQIQENSTTITDKINEGVLSCEEIISNAEILNRETEEASEVTKKIYQDVKSDVAKALDKAKAVEKINLMTNSIKDIASQTSLLALNASIEAARAGEAGRGFAIVAEQIGILANQSSDTVSNIGGIIDEVNSAVSDMTSSMEKTLQFMDTQILTDYAKFIEVSNQYSDKSTVLRGDMSDIAESIQQFMESLDSMSQSIKESAYTLEVASENTISLTEKNNQVASIAADTNEMAQESTESAEQLNKILKVFKL